MPTFCTNCGGPLADGAAFCTKCGARRADAPGPSVAPPYTGPQSYPPPAAPAFKSGGGPPYAGPQSYPPPAAPAFRSGGGPAKSGISGAKIILIILGVILVLGAIGVAGIAFVAYRAKNAIQQAAREKGVDLSDFSSSAGYHGSLPEACSLLTKEEASEIVGQTIERTEEHGNKCDYYAHPISEEERQERVKKAMEEIQAKSKSNNAAADAASKAGDAAALGRETGMSDLTHSLVAGANAGSGPYFSIEVNSNGKAAIAGMKMAMGIVAGGVKTTESIQGIGDEAMMGPMDSMFVFTKNGLGVQIDLRQVTQGRDRAIAMAKRILTRL